jgi:hypothetical protein
LRFRPNVLIDGPEAWSEFDWIGNKIALGDVELDVLKRTGRCAATDVDPESGKRDTAIPAVLQRTWGHTDFGVYARIAQGGTVSVGDPVIVRAQERRETGR